MTCITHEGIHLVGYSFVDDTYIVESDNDNEGPQATAMRIQGALDTWDGGIGIKLPHPQPRSRTYTQTLRSEQPYLTLVMTCLLHSIFYPSK
jgi:hypothetical protein